MVLYVFEVRGAAFVKVGFTARCPWGRVRDGLWRVRAVTGLAGTASSF